MKPAYAPETGRTAELRALATKKSQLNNSSIEQELYLLMGGRLEGWYACAENAPPQTEESRRTAELARIIRMMPAGMTPDEQARYIAAAGREVCR